MTLTENKVNKETSLSPTEEEQARIDARARQILNSPYSAPELIEWAMACASPEVSGAVYVWESIRSKRGR